jgi:hypothetical protein
MKTPPFQLIQVIALQAGAAGLAYIILTHGLYRGATLDGLALFIGTAATILCHEAAHFVAATHLGAAPVWANRKASVFSAPRSPRDQRLISLAGPIAGSACSLLFTGQAWLAHRQLLLSVACCLAISQIGMLLPTFQDGALLFMRKEDFYVK